MTGLLGQERDSISVFSSVRVWSHCNVRSPIHQPDPKRVHETARVCSERPGSRNLAPLPIDARFLSHIPDDLTHLMSHNDNSFVCPFPRLPVMPIESSEIARVRYRHIGEFDQCPAQPLSRCHTKPPRYAFSLMRTSWVSIRQMNMPLMNREIYWCRLSLLSSYWPVWNLFLMFTDRIYRHVSIFSAIIVILFHLLHIYEDTLPRASIASLDIIGISVLSIRNPVSNAGREKSHILIFLDLGPCPTSWVTCLGF